MIVYSDWVMTWLSGKTGKYFGQWSLALIVAVIIGLTVALMFYLSPIDARFPWWEPFALTAFWIALRLVKGLVVMLFYPDNE